MPLGPVEIPPSGGSQEVGIAQAVLAPWVTNEQPGNYRKGHRKLPAALGHPSLLAKSWTHRGALLLVRL